MLAKVFLNTTVEERMTFLEFQMTNVQEDVDDLNADVDFLFTEDAVQDARILDIELETESEYFRHI